MSETLIRFITRSTDPEVTLQGLLAAAGDNSQAVLGRIIEVYQEARDSYCHFLQRGGVGDPPNGIGEYEINTMANVLASHFGEGGAMTVNEDGELT
jgi:hypothetical protein